MLNPYRLVISFITFIRIVCCLNIYSTYIKISDQTMQMVLSEDVWTNVIVITFSVIVIDYIAILFIRNRN